jgi:hypothetical protein
MQKQLTLQEFYASDPRRARSHKVGYGSLWREFAPVPTYRLAWVKVTGELYAMELSEADEHKDPVEVLGVLWSWPQVEACLAGWPERCGDQRSLLWARERVRRWRPVLEESQFLQDGAWVKGGREAERVVAEQVPAERAAVERVPAGRRAAGGRSGSGRIRLARRVLEVVGLPRRQR